MSLTPIQEVQKEQGWGRKGNERLWMTGLVHQGHPNGDDHFIDSNIGAWAQIGETEEL